MAGRRQLRLDYGINPNANMAVNYHWNQARVYATFGIADHTSVGRAGAAAYHAAKYFKYAGRAMLLTGVAIDAISVVRSDRPLRRASQVVVAWAAAWVGCKVVGAGGAAIGALASPLGIAAGGFAGCIVGGIGGYHAGSIVAADVYDWASGTVFMPIPTTPTP